MRDFEIVLIIGDKTPTSVAIERKTQGTGTLKVSKKPITSLYCGRRMTMFLDLTVKPLFRALFSTPVILNQQPRGRENSRGPINHQGEQQRKAESQIQ